MKKIARKFFEQRRGNCAQAVAAAWQDKYSTQAGLEDAFAGSGHGKAPDGVCGALYASCQLAGAESAESIRAGFAERSGGHSTCRDIRRARALRCRECVEVAAGLLEEHCANTTGGKSDQTPRGEES